MTQTSFVMWGHSWPPCHTHLSTNFTHWGRDKMAATSQTTLSNAFSWMKMLEFWLKCHWSLFIRVQLTIFQHWFRWWLGADQAPSHYLNQWWLDYRCIYASPGLNELKLNTLVIYSIDAAIWIYDFDREYKLIKTPNQSSCVFYITFLLYKHVWGCISIPNKTITYSGGYHSKRDGSRCLIS